MSVPHFIKAKSLHMTMRSDSLCLCCTFDFFNLHIGFSNVLRLHKMIVRECGALVNISLQSCAYMSAKHMVYALHALAWEIVSNKLITVAMERKEAKRPCFNWTVHFHSIVGSSKLFYRMHNSFQTLLENFTFGIILKLNNSSFLFSFFQVFLFLNSINYSHLHTGHLKFSPFANYMSRLNLCLVRP